MEMQIDLDDPLEENERNVLGLLWDIVRARTPHKKRREERTLFDDRTLVFVSHKESILDMRIALQDKEWNEMRCSAALLEAFRNSPYYSLGANTQELLQKALDGIAGKLSCRLFGFRSFEVQPYTAHG